MKTDQLNHLLAIFAVFTLAMFATFTIFTIFAISVTMCIDIAAVQTEEEDIEWLGARVYALLGRTS